MQGFDLLIKILEGATVIIGVLVGGYKRKHYDNLQECYS